MLGPIQLLVLGFETNEKFKGDIMAELDTLRGRGIIRVLDLLFVMKRDTGEVIAMEESDLSEAEVVEVGAAISRLMGLTEATTGSVNPLTDTDNDYGLTREDITKVADQIEPGTSAAIVLIEHVWAARLKQAIREAGGYPIVQGFLTLEALMMIGEEVRAIAEAERAIEVAEAVKGAALLDALATVEFAEAVEEVALEEAAATVAAAELVKTAAVAEAVRTLIVAGLIEDAAAQEAIDTLVAADLIAADALADAEDVVAQAEAVAAAALARSGESTSDDDDPVGEPV